MEPDTNCNGFCLQKDDMLPKRYQETIDTDVKAGYVRKVQQVELNETRDKLQWYLPHHPVINSHKPENFRRVCNAASKYQSVSLKNKLLSGPNLLQRNFLEFLFFFTRTPNSSISRQRSNISSNRCPKRRQPNYTIFLAGRLKAKYGSLRVQTTLF